MISNFFKGIIIFLNVLLSGVLLLLLILRYIEPETASCFTVLTLGTPFLIYANLLCAVFWMFLFKRRVWISLVSLIFVLPFISGLYKISSTPELDGDELKILTYNVKRFDLLKYKSNNKNNKKTKFEKYVSDLNPDIICFQENYHEHTIKFDLNYKYEQLTSKKGRYKLGQSVWSKYPIISTGTLDFKDTFNNLIYADILYEGDTLRVYNLHLESFKISPQKPYLGYGDWKKALKHLQVTFEIQAKQAKQIAEHEANCTYRTILTGDFNNTYFSWVYTKIRGDKKDAFLEAGEGLSSTFDLKVPLRIDFILVHPDFEVKKYFTEHTKLSDHFPVMAYLKLKD